MIKGGRRVKIGKAGGIRGGKRGKGDMKISCLVA